MKPWAPVPPGRKAQPEGLTLYQLVGGLHRGATWPGRDRAPPMVYPEKH